MSRLNNSSNPVFRQVERTEAYAGENTASYAGIGFKIGIMFVLMLAGGFFSRYLLITNQAERLGGLIGIAAITGFVSVIIASISVRLAAPFSLLYALCQGVTIGTLTVLLESVIPGVGTVAAIATAVIFGVMFLLYSIRAIRVTPRFRKIMFGIIISLLLFSIMSIFIPQLRLLFAGNTTIALVFSGFLIVYGALMLTLDFDRAEMIVSSGADKRYEWTIAMGLMVTIVWIYVEILRFLVIIASNRD